MQRREQDRFRQQLRKTLSRMQPDVATVTEQARGASGSQAAGELSKTPMHLADQGTEEYLQDLNAMLLENEQYLAKECVEALERIEQGSFGVCENCKQPIAKERLQALPFVRHCVKCAEKLADAPDVNFNAGRPRSPADTLAPEGEMRESRRGRRAAAAGGFSRARDSEGDSHASGTAGGGTAVGGLAGTNVGRGDPDVGDLQQAHANGTFDLEEAYDDEDESPRSGRSGGAVGGTPAGKRAR